MDEMQHGGLSRREALKRGAVVAGAAWIAPAVMALPVSSASADAPSGGRSSAGGGQSKKNKGRNKKR